MSLIKRSDRSLGPDTLQDLCIFYCINNPESLWHSLVNLREAGDASAFSLLLGNKLLDYYLEYHIPSRTYQGIFDQMVQNSHLCNRLRINRNHILNFDNLLELSKNVIKYLELTLFDNNSDLEAGFLTLLEKNSQHLVSVKIQQKEQQGYCNELLQTLLGYNLNEAFEMNAEKEEEEEDQIDLTPAYEAQANQRYKIHLLDIDPSSSDCNPSDKHAPATNLRSFSYTTCYASDLETITDEMTDEFIFKVLDNNKQLQAVTVVSADSLPSVSYLSQEILYSLDNLRSLVLSSDAPTSNIADKETLTACFVKLPRLKQLQHLDVSYGKLPTGDGLEYSAADVSSFKETLLQMPQVKSLDISGTNLSTIVCHVEPKIAECTGHCMPGFEGRQFHYLGLYFTKECLHKCIPAVKVSGNETEEQLLVALWSHQHNKTIMLAVLKDLKTHIQSLQTNVKNPIAMVEGMISYMDQLKDINVDYKDAKEKEMRIMEVIFINIYLLLRYRSLENCLPLILKRRLLDISIVICDNCARDMLTTYGNVKDFLTQIVRLALLVIARLELDEITVYNYGFEKYMMVLIRLIKCRPIPQVMMFILKMVHNACRFSQELKVVAGQKLELLTSLLDEITAILTMVYGNNEILSKMWSIIWTLTDEVPINCELFVRNAGCEIALTTCRAITDDNDLKRKVSGAMCNVSENAHLRPLLMTQPLVKLFRELLDVYDSSNYDITSHAAAYLVLLAADGPEAWTLEDPTRDQVVAAVDDVITNHWDIETSKGVKFRSLTPMMLQLENFSTPTAQHWGAWMILNLVIVKPNRYCEMVVSEDGLEIIQRVLQHEELRDDIKTMLIDIRDRTNICMDSQEHRAHTEPSDD